MMDGMSETGRLPAGTAIYSCPLEACEWTFTELPLTEAGIERPGDGTAVLLRHVMAAEEEAKAHMETHGIVEWVQEIGRLQRTEQDARRVVAVLLRKLGGSAVISEEEQLRERGTLVRSPGLMCFSLTLRDG